MPEPFTPDLRALLASVRYPRCGCEAEQMSDGSLRLLLPQPAIDAITAALAPLVERIATLEKENAELRTVFGLVEAERDGQAAGTLPDVKFYDDPVAFAREMTARIVVDRDNKKHALRKALERAEAAEARCATLERERDEARRLGDLAVRARDHYDEDRRKAVQEMGGWKARAEQAESDLAACRAEVSELRSCSDDFERGYACGQRDCAEAKEAERDAIKADRDRLAAALTGLRQKLIDVSVEGVTAGASPQRGGGMLLPLWHMSCRACSARWHVTQWKYPAAAGHPTNECLIVAELDRLTAEAGREG